MVPEILFFSATYGLPSARLKENSGFSATVLRTANGGTLGRPRSATYVLNCGQEW